MDDIRRVQLKIHGRVQGVFYRSNARTTATRIGLSGWVRNCPDGTVEATAQGTQHDLDELIAWCRQGPPAARVERVEVASVPVEPDSPDGFSVRF